MKCVNCGEIKLCREFPSFPLTSQCQHPSLHCLRCVTSHWEAHKTCSWCSISVDESELNLRKCYSSLETLFPEITFDATLDGSCEDGESVGQLSVTKLNGESFDIPFVPTMTVYSLQKKIEQFMKVSPEKQSLLCNQTQLKVYKDDRSGFRTLADNDVKPNSAIYVMVLLYAVPANLDKVVFDLNWGYPATGRDYLDAGVVTFSGQKWLEGVHFDFKQCANGAIQHSGDVMDDFNRIGHHMIKVHLKRIPSNVTHVFFTLSSYKSSSIRHFPSPSMRFFDESNPDRMLCTEKISKAGHRRAIVMCSLMKDGNQWVVHSNGALSDGNICRFEPLLETVQGCIAKTGNYPYVPFKVHYMSSCSRSFIR